MRPSKANFQFPKNLCSHSWKAYTVWSADTHLWSYMWSYIYIYIYICIIYLHIYRHHRVCTYQVLPVETKAIIVVSGVSDTFHTRFLYPQDRYGGCICLTSLFFYQQNLLPIDLISDYFYKFTPHVIVLPRSSGCLIYSFPVSEWVRITLNFLFQQLLTNHDW